MLTKNAKRLLDPTRTISLRKAFAGEIRRRFAKLKARLFKLVQRDDSFGLTGNSDRQFPGDRYFHALVAVKDPIRTYLSHTRATSPQAVLDAAELAVSASYGETFLTGNFEYDGSDGYVQSAFRLNRSDWFFALYCQALRSGLARNEAVRIAVLAHARRPTCNEGWEFRTSAEQVELFKEWLEEQCKDLLTGDDQEDVWERYATAGFKKGAAKALVDSRDTTRVPDEYLRRAFSSPVAVEKIKLLAGRAFDDLEGVTADMSLRMGRILADGLVSGSSPADMAGELADQLDLSEDRALTVARTEIIRAHAEGQLDTLEDLGIGSVTAQVELLTAGDDRVCEECSALEGGVLAIDDAHGIIPVHPNCRCAWLPVVEEEVTANEGWITLESGQHVYIGQGGEVQPHGPGSGSRKTSSTGGRVARKAGGRKPEEPDRVGKGGREPARGKATGGVPKPVVGKSPEQAAALHVVDRRLDRVENFLRSKGDHEAAGFISELRDHVHEVGPQAALESLGPKGPSGGRQPVEYESAGQDMGDFCRSYLARVGIEHVESASGGGKHISPESEAFGTEKTGARGEFIPKEPTLKDKLEEAQHLPGLEKSRDLSELVGREATHLTPDVVQKLDSEYGEGKWIVKPYGDTAYGGHGIFFPQRAEKIAQDARNTIWSAGEKLDKYGFSVSRDEAGNVSGIAHSGGDTYRFGSKEYNEKVYGEVREVADRVAAAGPHERGAALPGGGKEFMAQPAFESVGISDAERAAGVTGAEGGKGEGRVHIVTKDGKAEVIPHSTWIKGESLPVVFESADTKAMAKAALDAVNALPHSERRGQIYAPDIMRTKGGYRVVEANPGNYSGSSGYLGDNPVVIDSYVSHLTGREPEHVKFIRSMLAKRGTGNEQMRGADGRLGPGGSRGIARESMPQVKTADVPEFLEFCRDSGVVVKHTVDKAGDLRPAQGEFRQERIDSLPDEALASPILVSLDGFVLDGTHRWMKHWQKSKESAVPVVEVGLDLDDAIAIMRKFPKVKYTENRRP